MEIIWLFGIFLLVLFGVTYFGSRGFNKSKEGFLLADRKLNLFESTFAVAASWIWATVFVVTPQKAYLQGFVGVFWFAVPNILCLILFSYFIKKIIDQYPEGFTISEYIKEKLSHRVQFLYWIGLIGISIGALVLNLVVGGTIITKLTGIPFFFITLMLLLIPFMYSYLNGLKASVISDYFKLSLIFAILSVLIPSFVINTGGINNIINGFGGISGKFTSLFSKEGLNVFLTFGLPTTIGLLAGPFSDQTFWQKGFATRKDVVKKSFIYGAFIFAFIPLLVSIIGFSAAGLNYNIKDPGFIIIEMISNVLPITGIILLSFIFFSVITSVIDSKYCSISSIAGNDIVKKYFKNVEENSLKYSKISMVILALIALAIANIPGIKVLYVFLINGTLRSPSFLPTILTIKGVKLSEQGVFYGMLFAILVGTPFFAYGVINQITNLIVFGSLFTVLIPGMFGYFWKK